MHEGFLQRLAGHPTLRNDYSFQTFLEYDGDVGAQEAPLTHTHMFSLLQLSVRTKNTREKLGSLFKGFSKSMDENIILKNHKDVDPWFETEKKFLADYHMQ